jgi:cytochrome c peroxidase
MARLVRRHGRSVVVALAALATAAACRERTPRPATDGVTARVHATPAPENPPAHERELDALRAFEQERRAHTDFAVLPPSEQVLGPDPYRLAALHDGRLVGILRGDSALVLLDRDGAELARIAAPRSTSGLAVSDRDDILVVGDGAREIAVYRTSGAGSNGNADNAGAGGGNSSVAGGAPGALVRTATIPVDALGMRSIALSPDARTAYVVEERTGRMLAVALERERGGAIRSSDVRELSRCHGPFQVEAIAGHVAVNCLLDHTIEIHREGGEVAHIHHDGPMWSFALRGEPDGGALVAIGGVEDHPLEREDGGFGYIDSHLFVYRLAPGAAQATRLATINTSALDVVTPKWIVIRAANAVAVSVMVAGYASPSLVTVTWPRGDFAAEPQVDQASLVPGTTAAQLTRDGVVIAADPLLDAWIVKRGGDPKVIPVASASATARSELSRVGEMLFFTTMMSPWNSSDGKLSRFTCETCHHEGYVDGRTHFTGRGDVFATTRPLLGLFNNRPHFSRAFDKTMAQMVQAEFRVANRHNGRDPWFALTRADVPWLERVPGVPEQLPPERLRQAFMSFLMDFSHRANPAAIASPGSAGTRSTPGGSAESIDHEHFTALERTGAEVFRDRCAGCHAARLVADEPTSLVPFERWESLVLSPSGPIVWTNAAYEKTGVTPYVHTDGARVPALRRLYKKWPYFTSGRAKSLADLLDRFASSPTATYHDAAPAEGPGPTAGPLGSMTRGAQLTRLTADEKSALLAFLDLL